MPKVLAVSLSEAHDFSKETKNSIELIAGIGVKGDAHSGKKVKHRSRVRRNPNQANLRQVHLIQNELLEDLNKNGFSVKAADLGENITTQNIDLLVLPTNTKLAIGDSAVIQITGLRNPCAQLDNFQYGLTKAVLDRDKNGDLIRKAGVMAIVLEGGIIKPDDKIEIELPEGVLVRLEPV